MDELELLNYFHFRHPDVSDFEIRNLENITSGWETEIYSFDLVRTSSGDETSQKLVARIYPGKNAEWKARKEATTMKRLLTLGYPVPFVHLVETESPHLGQPFMLMDRIDGGTLDARLQRNFEKWLNQFSILFVKLHLLNWKSFLEEPEKFPINDQYHYINSTLSEYENALRQSQKQELLPIIMWLKKRSDDVPCKTPSIVHRDFHPFNILVDENENSYVIDWAGAGIADFRSDLAWTLLLHFAFSTKEHRDATLKSYETVLGHEVEKIEYFEVLAIARRLHDVMSSFDRGADELGMRPEAVEMMKESIGHIVRVRDRLEDLTELSIPEVDEFIRKMSE